MKRRRRKELRWKIEKAGRDVFFEARCEEVLSLVGWLTGLPGSRRSLPLRTRRASSP